MPELDNVALARHLELTADLLEIDGADRFRVLSYRKAADAVRTWPEQVAVLAEEGRLTDIPGVGRKLADGIGHMLREGTFPETEEVASRIPVGLAEVTRVPGVGPKRAKQLLDTLGIDSVAALDAALDAGRLDRVGGLGAKSVAGIRAGLDSYLAHRGRLLLEDALPLGEHFLDELRAVPGVERAELAGSLRRMRESVARIVVVASAADPGKVLDGLAALPAAASSTREGPSTASVLTSAGPRVEVLAVTPERFGSALVWETGGAGHRARLEALAAARGLSFSGEGLAGTARAPDQSSEDAVYAALGFRQVPPPELREDTGEVEAALAGELPELLALADVRGDFHVHSTSTDARSTIEENRAMAASLGYEYVAVTDHAYDLRMVRGLSVAELEEQWRHVDALNAARGDLPVVLKGIELNIGEGGRVDYADDVLARFDFCIASLHTGWNLPAAEMTDRLVAAMRDPFVDIIGHPTGRIIGRRDPIPLDMDRVLTAAAETGTVMELNAYPDRLDLRDEHLRLAKGLGVRIAIGTDAHRDRHLRHMRYGVATARRGWITPAECLNAQPLETVRSWLKRARA